jgi:hypothetical protein
MLDFHVESSTRLAGDKRNRQSARRTARPSRSWFDPGPTTRRELGEIDFVWVAWRSWNGGFGPSRKCCGGLWFLLRPVSPTGQRRPGTTRPAVFSGQPENDVDA